MLAIAVTHQLQARVLVVPSVHPCLLQLAQARTWKLSSSLSSRQAAAASPSGEGLAPKNTAQAEAVQHRTAKGTLLTRPAHSAPGAASSWQRSEPRGNPDPTARAGSGLPQLPFYL